MNLEWRKECFSLAGAKTERGGRGGGRGRLLKRRSGRPAAAQVHKSGGGRAPGKGRGGAGGALARSRPENKPIAQRP